jgi:regulator of ribonuclease activity A
MRIPLPDLCDAFPEAVRVAEPVFRSYGGYDAFHGEITTIKCFEDNSLVAEKLAGSGNGRVLVVDAGGSLRCGMLGDNLAQAAVDHGWSGVVVYGCIRDVDQIKQLPLGVQALAAHPMKSVKRGIGQYDQVLSFAGITVSPGEYLYADHNGLLVAAKSLQLAG